MYDNLRHVWPLVWQLMPASLDQLEEIVVHSRRMDWPGRTSATNNCPAHRPIARVGHNIRERILFGVYLPLLKHYVRMHTRNGGLDMRTSQQRMAKE